MRKRGQSLDSPEANFMFGGPYNEQIYTSPDGRLMPYDARTAAVDSLIDSPTPIAADSLIDSRDELSGRIRAAIPQTKRIEEERKQVADALSEQLDS